MVTVEKFTSQAYLTLDGEFGQQSSYGNFSVCEPLPADYRRKFDTMQVTDKKG